MAVSHVRTGDQALMRNINRTLILKCVRETAPISRAQLSEHTGLNKTTVSSIVTDLIANGLIREIGSRIIGAGRPGILLELDPRAGHIISVEIGIDFISLISTNFMAQIEWQHRQMLAEPANSGQVISELLQLLSQALAAVRSFGSRVFGIAIGVPGLVEHQTGQVLFAPNLHWHTVALEQTIADALGLPVYLDNEANMAALGELYFGAAQGYKDVLYLSMGVGLGGGIIANGQLFTGHSGFAGEFGHIALDPNGRLCNCGNYGCFETMVSLPTLYDYVRQSIAQRDLQPSRSELPVGSILTFEQVTAAGRAGDPLVMSAFAQVGRSLGIGLANLVNIFDPQVIVLGGELSRASDLFLPSAMSELARRLAPWQRGVPNLVQARYQHDACLMGGVATVYDRIVNRPWMT